MKIFHGFVWILLSWFILPSSAMQGQSGEILHDLYKLKNVGTVLYVAAHPDDENTRLISYFSNHEKVRTVYLSLTRGDGGQNLIGPELREQLGLIRTHELLQARNIDGGTQFFSRANDFGYSKSPEETLKIWDKKEVLADVVWAIRKHKPDIIVNRFNHENNRRTHGHHTASAMLSVEAFDMAGDPNAFPEQLEFVDVWQPKRIYFNTSWWFYGSREKFAEADKSQMAEIDVGQYYPLLGLSNNEISAASRSMHKCQGFGSATGRGSYFEYLQYIKGDLPDDKNNVLDGVPLNWARLNDASHIDTLLDEVISNFNPLDPSQSIPALLDVRREISMLNNSHWSTIKMAQIDDIIFRCAGLFLRAEASVEEVSSGQELEYSIEMVNRSAAQITMHRLQSSNLNLDTVANTPLANNQELIWSRNTKLGSLPASTPYWLSENSDPGMYQVSNQIDRGRPLGDPPLSVDATLLFGTDTLRLNLPLYFVRVDPVKGELVDPVKIIPEVHLRFDQDHTLFKPNESKTIQIEITAQTEIDSAKLRLASTNNWLFQMKDSIISLFANQTKVYTVDITAPGIPESIDLQAEVVTNFGKYNTGIQKIAYDHIPVEQIEKPAKTVLKCIDLKTEGYRIGYIEGAGDLVDESLKEIGYQVDIIDIGNTDLVELSSFDAIVIGIRAWNTNKDLAKANDLLFEYVNKGGTVISQYNTRHRLKTIDIGPGSIQLSRGRVTDEYSPVTILEPEHPAMTYPNQITLKDFDGWVQERGLYFPEEWSEEYVPLLQMSDPGEEPLNGSLLVGQFGQGHYCYSSLSYFRQLPAGVEGAYRLLANLIALNQNNRP